uniref:Restriction endonuclease n=1 Tax=Siphoviridae sp. cthae16 TaxID=2825617 RepID=A0A8S5URS9_9CAUD|nr:MAG TPA: Restriction endonuclease [Siphoviridae sp. cthae16]
MSTLNFDFSQKGAATTEPVYMARRPIKNLVKPLVYVGIFFMVGLFYAGSDSASNTVKTLWLIGFLLWIYFSIVFSFCCFAGRRYTNKNAIKLPILVQKMDKAQSMDAFFESRDELVRYLSKMSRWENYKTILKSKPSKLLVDLYLQKTNSTNDALRRTAAKYQELTRESNVSFVDAYKDDVDKYKRRLNSENIAVYDSCCHDLEVLAQVVGTIDEVDIMSGNDFEHWCADLLAHNGFTNVIVTQASGDQGVDVTATKGGVKYAVQCKCYSSDLGNTPVQEVYAGKAMYECQVGVVMTNRYFTAGAKSLASKTGVLLWDRDKLIELMANKI